MSRVLEVVVEDAPEIVPKRAYAAFRRIGKVLEYKPDEFIEGRVYVEGWPALLTVEWHPSREEGRFRLDLAATSSDELSRAADASMYLFARTYKALTAEEWERAERQRHSQPRVVVAMAVVLVIALVALLVAQFVLRIPLLPLSR